MKTLFTDRQLEIARLIRSGKARSDIASDLGITVQDISITEKRFRENLEKAINTINVARNLSISYVFSIRSGSHILDAGKEIMSFADSHGIKLRENTISIVTGLRIYLGSDMKNGIMKRDVDVALLPDGGIRYL